MAGGGRAEATKEHFDRKHFDKQRSRAMPRYDGTGPMGVGPHMGGGRGRGRRPADESVSMEDPYQYYGIGWGYSPWPEGGGRRRFRGRGSGRGRGFGRARRGTGDLVGPDGGGRQRETFLMRRMDELTAALDRMKKLLSKHSPAKRQDRS